jgi:hypothetical protein
VRKAKKIRYVSDTEEASMSPSPEIDIEHPKCYTGNYAKKLLPINPRLIDRWNVNVYKKPSHDCRLCEVKFGDYFRVEGHFSSEFGGHPDEGAYVRPLCNNNKQFKIKRGI